MREPLRNREGYYSDMPDDINNVLDFDSEDLEYGNDAEIIGYGGGSTDSDEESIDTPILSPLKESPEGIEVINYGDVPEEEDSSIFEGYSENDGLKEIKGITDSVTGYTYTNLSYPCIVFKQGIQLEKHKVSVISNMVKSKAVGLVKDTSLYFITDDDQMFKIGMINGMQVGSLIDIAGRDNLTGFAEDGKELKDSLIYTLCIF